MVSTSASGTAPMAARSLTLVSMAATPAANGSACTKAGSSASPPTTTVSRPAATTAPSSPGPASQSLRPKTLATREIGVFARRPGEARTVAAISSRVLVAPVIVMAIILVGPGSLRQPYCTIVNGASTIGQVTPSSPQDTPPAPALPDNVAVVNVGLSLFADAIAAQGRPVADVDCRIPAGGDPEADAPLPRLTWPPVP